MAEFVVFERRCRPPAVESTVRGQHSSELRFAVLRLFAIAVAPPCGDALRADSEDAVHKSSGRRPHDSDGDDPEGSSAATGWEKAGPAASQEQDFGRGPTWLRTSDGLGPSPPRRPRPPPRLYCYALAGAPGRCEITHSPCGLGAWGLYRCTYLTRSALRLVI